MWGSSLVIVGHVTCDVGHVVTAADGDVGASVECRWTRGTRRSCLARINSVCSHSTMSCLSKAGLADTCVNSTYRSASTSAATQLMVPITRTLASAQDLLELYSGSVSTDIRHNTSYTHAFVSLVQCAWFTVVLAKSLSLQDVSRNVTRSASILWHMGVSRVVLRLIYLNRVNLSRWMLFCCSLRRGPSLMLFTSIDSERVLSVVKCSCSPTILWH